MPNQPVSPTKPKSDASPQKQQQAKTADAGSNRIDSIQPGKLIFLTGIYKGRELNLGVGIESSSSSQSAIWNPQKGHSLRVGKTFQNIEPRSLQIKLEFYDLVNDISSAVENLFHMQEIDPESGEAPRLHYQEGTTKMAPLVCMSISPKKDTPFPGGKGFHHCEVDLSFEVFGGRASEHRLAPPLAPTALKAYADSLTAADRERKGSAAAAKVALADCLSPQDSEAIEKLLSEDKAGDVGRVKSLSDSALVQAAIAGIIPKEVVAQLDSKLSGAIAYRMAATLPGVGKDNAALIGALSKSIQGVKVPLPPDIGKEVEALRQQHALIVQGVSTQRLGDNDPVMAQSGVNDRLRRVGSCGLRLRQANATSISKQASGGLPVEWVSYFDRELGDKSNDAQARDRLVLNKANERLSKADDDQIMKEFGLKDKTQVEALKSKRPYKTKDEFTTRLDPKNRATGLASWSAYTDTLAGAPAAAPQPTPLPSAPEPEV